MQREKKTARVSCGAGYSFAARFCRFLCVNVRKKQALAWVLLIALVCAVFPITAAAEEPAAEAPAEITEEIETASPEETQPEEEVPAGEQPAEEVLPEKEPTEEMPEEEEPTEEESQGEEFSQEEEDSPEEEPPEEDLLPDAEEPVYFVTVEWTVESATINIDRVCEYVWNTETLQYEPVSDRLEIGEGKTADVELTITSFSTAPVSYEIRYTDNPADALTTEAEEDSGMIPVPEDTELGQTAAFSGTVTVTGIAADAQLTDGTDLILGTYTVTVCGISRDG